MVDNILEIFFFIFPSFAVPQLTQTAVCCPTKKEVPWFASEKFKGGSAIWARRQICHVICHKKICHRRISVSFFPCAMIQNQRIVKFYEQYKTYGLYTCIACWMCDVCQGCVLCSVTREASFPAPGCHQRWSASGRRWCTKCCGSCSCASLRCESEQNRWE